MRPTKPCEWCGDDFEYKKSHEDQRKFCSVECKGEFQSSEWSEKHHPRWDGGNVEVECEWCGGVYSVAPHREDSTRFCSRSCFGSWKSESWSGEGSPLWDGGYNKYIGNWNRNRERALERDGHRCQVCSNEEDLHVHHITPVVEFDGDDPEMHAVDNLVTLCSTCHPKVESGEVDCPKP
jgi:5-methylcytosine-specific restriction endonuclease McrA